jgi:hypothetical protein
MAVNHLEKFPRIQQSSMKLTWWKSSEKRASCSCFVPKAGQSMPIFVRARDGACIVCFCRLCIFGPRNHSAAHDAEVKSSLLRVW